MVRRWSHINDINFTLSSTKSFNKSFKISIFKSTVQYKRFTFKRTKFKRKSLIRFKHRSNWLMYTNVFKTWVNDYGFNKHLCRSQFVKNIYINNFFFYNFNFVKNRSDLNFYNFNFIFSTWSKQSYFYYHPRSFKYFKDNNLTFGWFTDNLTFDRSIVPVYHQWDDQLYAFNAIQRVKFDLNSLIDSLFFISIQKILEIRKILTLLYYLNILNFKNVK